MTATFLETFEMDEDSEDTYEFVSSLFNLEEKVLLNNKLFPLVRLEKLNTIKKNILEEKFEKEEAYDYAVRTISCNYLLRIFQDLLGIDSEGWKHSEALTSNVLYLIQKEITCFDVVPENKSTLTSTQLNTENLKKIFNNYKEFHYTFLSSERNYSKKRNLIIEEAFQGNSKKYLNLFKEKLFSVSGKIYKYILLQELQKVSYEQMAYILIYLVQSVENCFYANSNDTSNKNAELFFKSNYWGELLTKDQKAFYLSIQSIYEKLKKHNFLPEVLTVHNKDIIETFLWFKSSPKEALKTLEILNGLYEKNDVFASDKPNNLLFHIYELKEQISKLTGKTYIYSSGKRINSLTSTDEMFAAKQFCESITEQTLHVCRKILYEEESIVRNLIKVQTGKKLKQISKKLFYIILVLVFFGTLKFVSYYFFDIHSIYSRYLQNAKLTMEAIPYHTELKDSLDPVQNETNQRLRLDYINSLNSRYFKALTIFLTPNISDEIINRSLPLLMVPDDIKDVDSIKIIRGYLSKMFDKNEWEISIEPMLGPNVLMELRAYGAICNFLVPSLAHYVLLDKNGLPLKINGVIQLSNYLPDNEKNTEPKYYLDKFDSNYKNIKNISIILLSRLSKIKQEVITLYKKSYSKEEKIKLKTLLQGIAITEIRLRDLKSKIQERHDYIVKHNTYRAILE